MRRSIRHVAAALLAAGLLCSGTAIAAPGEPGTDRPAVREAMDELARSGASGVQVRLADQQGPWTGSAGVAELGQPQPVPRDGRFRAGSISKTMLSATLLQLVDEGKIALDRPATEYLPEFGLDRRITVRMLLQHTSGIFNYTGDANPDGSAEPGIPLFGRDFAEHRFDTYQPDQLVRFALSKPARFEPGTNWSYSNTNYVLVALIVQKVTGTPYTTLVERRILRPLGMRDTVFPGARPEIAGPHAHGYYGFQQDGTLNLVDATELNPSWAYGAGEAISTTRDLDTFVSALLGGKLMSPRSLDEMRKMRPTAPGTGYGLGLVEMDLGQCGVLIGHTGGIHGYNSYLFSSPDRAKRFEMSVTMGAIDARDPQTAQRLQKSIEKVVTTAVCGKQVNVAPGAVIPEFR